MNFIEFKQKFGKNRLIDIQNVINCYPSFDRRRLYEWQKKNYLKKIANNLYVFSDARADDTLLRYIASALYQPSYLALETALMFYHFIPEAVFQMISVSPKRNKEIQTELGYFRYRKIKPSLFFGYNAIHAGDGSFYLSDPEKALLDMLYFTDNADKKEVLTELRLNFAEIKKSVQPEKLRKYCELFHSPKVTKGMNWILGQANVEF